MSKFRNLLKFLLILILHSCISLVHSYLTNKIGTKPNIQYTKLYASDTSASLSNDAYDKEINEVFPPMNYQFLMDRDCPDFENLPPNDPLFLDMPWPTERGPIASAFARHLQWKRKLSDGERLRWQKWAVYKRLMRTDMFKYRVDDYIIQNLIQTLIEKSELARHTTTTTTTTTTSEENRMKNRIDSTLYRAALLGLLSEEEKEIQAILLSFYKILNRKNYDEIRTLWLPDASVELLLPGYDKVNGHFESEKLFRKMIKDNKPIGTITPNIIKVQVYGFISVVYTIETISAGHELKTLRKRGTPPPKPSKKPPSKVLSVTVLRKFNQQWRIMSHHAVPYTMSTNPLYSEQLIDIIDSFQRKSSDTIYTSASKTLSPIQQIAAKLNTKTEKEVINNDSVGTMWRQLRDYTTTTNDNNNSNNNNSAKKESIETRVTENGTVEKVISVKNNEGFNNIYDKGGLLYDEATATDSNSDNNSNTVSEEKTSMIQKRTESDDSESEEDDDDDDDESPRSILEKILLQNTKNVLGSDLEFKRDKNGQIILQKKGSDNMNLDTSSLDTSTGNDSISSSILGNTENSSKKKDVSDYEIEIDIDIDEDALSQQQQLLQMPQKNDKGLVDVKRPLKVAQLSSKSVSIYKKTTQALRLLQQHNKLTSQEKNMLLFHMINAASDQEPSIIQTAFELLVLQHFDGNDYDLYYWTPKITDVGMNDFYAQCKTILSQLEPLPMLLSSSSMSKKTSKKKGKDWSNQYTYDNDDDDDDNDDDDEEESDDTLLSQDKSRMTMKKQYKDQLHSSSDYTKISKENAINNSSKSKSENKNTSKNTEDTITNTKKKLLDAIDNIWNNGKTTSSSSTGNGYNKNKANVLDTDTDDRDSDDSESNDENNNSNSNSNNKTKDVKKNNNLKKKKD